MTSIEEIVSRFAEVHGTESEKLAWLRGQLTAFSEELAAEIESKIVPEPTQGGKLYNSALQEAAAIIRKTIAP